MNYRFITDSWLGYSADLVINTSNQLYSLFIQKNADKKGRSDYIFADTQKAYLMCIFDDIVDFWNLEKFRKRENVHKDWSFRDVKQLTMIPPGKETMFAVYNIFFNSLVYSMRIDVEHMLNIFPDTIEIEENVENRIWDFRDFYPVFEEMSEVKVPNDYGKKLEYLIDSTHLNVRERLRSLKYK